MLHSHSEPMLSCDSHAFMYISDAMQMDELKLFMKMYNFKSHFRARKVDVIGSDRMNALCIYE